MTRIYQAWDNCNNQSTCVQTINVNNITPPIVPPDITSTIECLLEAIIPVPPVVVDACGGLIIPVMTESADPICDGAKIFTFTYTECTGLVSIWQRIYLLDHVTNPTIGPALTFSTVACLALAVEPDSLPVVIDVCDNVLLPDGPPVINDSPSSLTCEGSRTYTFTYTDCEGLAVTWVYTYTIEYVPFQPIPPMSGVADCYLNIVLPALPVVMDNCGVLLFPSGPVETGTSICEDTITYTWIYTDCEGNSRAYIYTVTIEYDTFPGIAPTSGITDCYANIVLPVPPVVTDHCGTTISPTGPVESGVADCENAIISYTWTYVDCEGNSQQYVHNVTIEYQPFSNATPTTGTIDCYVNIILPAPPVMTDNCGLTLVPTGPVENGSVNCDNVITFTWTYTDCEGNTAIYQHAITIRDDVAPTINCQPFTFNGCNTTSVPFYIDLQQFLFSGGSVSDNCLIDTASFQMLSETSDNSNCTEVITRTYQIADFCGNTSSCNQVITLIDQTPPVIICPATATVECQEDLPASYSNLSQFLADGGTASDPCGYLASSFALIDEVLLSSSCPRIIERTYEITDSCGNTAYCIQTLIVSDLIPPQLSNIPP
ncbi:MAG: hypothetical protein ABIT06_07060, partial [Saprospiraceae bacterium]